MSVTPAGTDLTRYRREELLKDGSRIVLRPIEKSDVPLWLAFLSRLSTHTKYLRFHNIPREMTEEDAIRYCEVDYNNSFAYVAEIGKGKDRKIIAIARYYRLPNESAAEAAFAVEDSYQNIGLGTRLVQALADVASEKGIAIFKASVLAENLHMMETFRDYSLDVSCKLEDGVYDVTFPVRQTRIIDKK